MKRSMLDWWPMVLAILVLLSLFATLIDYGGHCHGTC